LGTTATYMRHNDHRATHLSTKIDLLHDRPNNEYRFFSAGSVGKWSKFGLGPSLCLPASAAATHFRDASNGHPSIVQFGSRRSRCPTVEPALMSMEIALDIWKWRFLWPLRISSMSVGNDFQRPRGNQGFRHFQMSSISTPYGGTTCARCRRPVQAVGLPRWLRSASVDRFLMLYHNSISPCFNPLCTASVRLDAPSFRNRAST
jgi:hypothetical protein